MTELIVIRHGETDWNRQQRFQGQIDVPLNALGLTQAQRLAQRMARERVDALWSSDLLRAQATADALAQALDLSARIEPLWREQSFGVLEGLDVPTIRREHAPLWSQWLRYDADYALPGGESVREFHGRVLRALDLLADIHAGQRVAVVTHGGVLDMLWRTAQGAPLHGPRTVDIPNTGLNLLRWRDGTLEVLEWADAAHLEGLPEQPSTAQRRPDPA
jgi:2,3-bisphosphoglycerate-dependent phosphoglycerate mutase